MSNSLRPHGLYSPGNSPGQNTGVGSLSLLQGIFPAQGSNPGLPHCRWILYQLNHREAQESWSGRPIASPGDLPDPGIEPGSPALQADSLPAEAPSPYEIIKFCRAGTFPCSPSLCRLLILLWKGCQKMCPTQPPRLLPAVPRGGWWGRGGDKQEGSLCLISVPHRGLLL